MLVVEGLLLGREGVYSSSLRPGFLSMVLIGALNPARLRLAHSEVGQRFRCSTRLRTTY